MWPSFFKAAAAAHLLHWMMDTLKRKAAVAAFARLRSSPAAAAAAADASDERRARLWRGSNCCTQGEENTPKKKNLLGKFLSCVCTVHRVTECAVLCAGPCCWLVLVCVGQFIAVI